MDKLLLMSVFIVAYIAHAGCKVLKAQETMSIDVSSNRQHSDSDVATGFISIVMLLALTLYLTAYGTLTPSSESRSIAMSSVVGTLFQQFSHDFIQRAINQPPTL